MKSQISLPILEYSRTKNLIAPSLVEISVYCLFRINLKLSRLPFAQSFQHLEGGVEALPKLQSDLPIDMTISECFPSRL